MHDTDGGPFGQHELYPSSYEKINKEFIVRAIGTKNFEFLKAQIGES
jgi:hypothetical protein